jgi:hypothetical protein
MRKTFREFIELKEAMTKQPGMMVPNIGNPDAGVDDEIAKNPQLLMSPKANPQQVKPVIDQAVQKKKMMPNVSMDAALKAAQMAAKRLGQQGR